LSGAGAPFGVTPCCGVYGLELGIVAPFDGAIGGGVAEGVVD
jgi:hypothetical protein